MRSIFAAILVIVSPATNGYPVWALGLEMPVGDVATPLGGVGASFSAGGGAAPSVLASFSLNAAKTGFNFTGMGLTPALRAGLSARGPISTSVGTARSGFGLYAPVTALAGDYDVSVGGSDGAENIVPGSTLAEGQRLISLVHEEKKTPPKATDLALEVFYTGPQPAAGFVLGEYDYVVVGAGAGGITAVELAKAGKKVALVDAGGAEPPIESDVPVLHAVTAEHPKASWVYGVHHYSDSNQEKRDPVYDDELSGVFYPRGTGKGGSYAVNAGFSVAPHAGDFDRVAQKMGNPEFNDAAMWQELIELTDTHYRPMMRLMHRIGQILGLKFLQNRGKHGVDGPISLSQPGMGLLAQDSQLRGVIWGAAAHTLSVLHKEAGAGLRNKLKFYLEQAFRMLHRFDPNDWSLVRRRSEGLAMIPIAVDPSGRRSSVRNLIDAALKTSRNLTFVPHTLVGKVVFDKDMKATGVEVLQGPNLYEASRERGGEPQRKGFISAREGVVLAAGALNTPQITMLSGIGPRVELEKHGIETLLDLPEVGTNLHDRYETPVIVELKENFKMEEGLEFKASLDDPGFKEWNEKGNGIYATNGSPVSIIKKSDPSLEQPNLLVFGLGGYFPSFFRGYSQEATRRKNILTWMILEAKTANRAGTVRLKSADPRQRPDIQFHYFDESRDGKGNPAGERDLKPLLYGVDFIRGVNRRFQHLIRREIFPGDEADTEAKVAEKVKNGAMGHHAVGSMAKALDNKGRVRGTRNVWVADASFFEDIPGFFVGLPIMMLAKKIARLILDLKGQ